MALENTREAHPELEIAFSALSAVTDADLLLVGTEWPEFAGVDPAAAREEAPNALVLDARRILPAEQWRAAGWSVRVVGTAAS
jgi:UDPglucose 6-dehydrogenase